jgi:hypothetical protein
MNAVVTRQPAFHFPALMIAVKYVALFIINWSVYSFQADRDSILNHYSIKTT